MSGMAPASRFDGNAVSERAGPMPAWESQFPDLFAPWQVPYAPVVATFGTAYPDEALISRIHVVARADGGVVVCRSANGWRFLPGGTREPGETVE